MSRRLLFRPVADNVNFIRKLRKCSLQRKTNVYLYQDTSTFTGGLLSENVQEFKGFPIPSSSITEESITDLLNTDQSKKERGESPRHKYGQYKNVLLSDEDFEKLKAEFPADYEDRIDNLSEYMASTGRSYKNHLVTIRRWSRRDNGRKPVYQQSSSPAYSADRYETTKRRSL